MTEDMTVYGDSRRPVLPTWPYVIAGLMIAVAALLFRFGDPQLQKFGVALILVCSVYCWGVGYYWLRERFRRSQQWKRRPTRFWLSVAPTIILMVAWPTLLLATLLT